MFYIGLHVYREVHGKKFLSEAIWYVASPCGPQVCSNYAPGSKNGPAPGVTYFTLAYIGKNMKKSSCLKSYGLEP